MQQCQLGLHPVIHPCSPSQVRIGRFVAHTQSSPPLLSLLPICFLSLLVQLMVTIHPNTIRMEIFTMRTCIHVTPTTGREALNPQYPIVDAGFPFHINLAVAAKIGPQNRFSPAFDEKFKTVPERPVTYPVTLKTNFTVPLASQLSDLAGLPQHLKRAAINLWCEYYLPEIMIAEDPLWSLLSEFRHRWNSGDLWMLHIFTKSDEILMHRDLLKDMRQMVQVEMCIAHPDNSHLEQFELYAPSVATRLKTVRELSDNGIFVRVRANGYHGRLSICNELARASRDASAKAFLFGTSGFRFTHRSGERVKTPPVTVKMPGHPGWAYGRPLNSKRNVRVAMPVIDMGYAVCNGVDWGYIR
jgi:hypothetical protein